MDGGNTALGFAMEHEFQWDGPDLVEKSLDAEATELRYLFGGLVGVLERFIHDDRLANRPDVVRPLEDLVRAYSMAAPVLSHAQQPIAHRNANAGDTGSLLARVTIAEVRAVAALADARSRFFYRLLRDASVSEG